MGTWRNRALRSALILMWVMCLPGGNARAQTSNTCLDCHGVLDPPLQVTADQFAQDIHSQKGLNCASCHGGDPTKSDMDAMSKASGFRGKIQRSQIPELCGWCHSDAAYMRRHNPSLRTDQLSQYKTSAHGKLLAQGNTKVAVCIDCHGVHDLRPASDTRSTVNPSNVAQTCSRCHSNAEYMKDYHIPTDQFAKYSVSVHHEAMTVQGDLSAPTCTTCHGNHGAAPPGVERGAKCLLYLPCFPVPDVRKKLTQGCFSGRWPSRMRGVSQQSRNRSSHRRETWHGNRRRLHAVPYLWRSL